MHTVLKDIQIEDLLACHMTADMSTNIILGLCVGGFLTLRWLGQIGLRPNLNLILSQNTTLIPSTTREIRNLALQRLGLHKTPFYGLA